nr:hypothetical protein TetV2_00231 [Oceanusvirus sp.]
MQSYFTDIALPQFLAVAGNGDVPDDDLPRGSPKNAQTRLNVAVAKMRLVNGVVVKLFV